VHRLAPDLLVVFKPSGHQEDEHAHARRQRLFVLRGKLLVRTRRRSLVLRPRDPAITLRANQRHATTALADTWVIAEYP
jgi:quercetin dioxygenase-like cupin family protein